MILMGSGMGVVIEAWKVRKFDSSPLSRCLIQSPQITKAVDISIKPAAPGAIFPYRLDVKGGRYTPSLEVIPG